MYHHQSNPPKSPYSPSAGFRADVWRHLEREGFGSYRWPERSCVSVIKTITEMLSSKSARCDYQKYERLSELSALEVCRNLFRSNQAHGYLLAHRTVMLKAGWQRISEGDRLPCDVLFFRHANGFILNKHGSISEWRSPPEWPAVVFVGVDKAWHCWTAGGGEVPSGERTRGGAGGMGAVYDCESEWEWLRWSHQSS